jgi:hypothetical protein
MIRLNPNPTEEFLHGIHDIFHPEGDNAFYINHPCFLVNNHIVKINQIYALLDYEEDSVSSIIPFHLEDILIIDNFIMVVGLDMITGEELGRNEYLIDNEGCAFKMVDFDYLKTIMNRTETKTPNLLIQPESL